MQRPGHRKRRGRTTLSNHPSGGAVLNWSPLHTRQWADNKCILRFVALFSIPNSGLVSLVGLADGQPGPPSVLTPNSGSRKPALSTCSRILDSDDRAGFCGCQPRRIALGIAANACQIIALVIGNGYFT